MFYCSQSANKQQAKSMTPEGKVKLAVKRLFNKHGVWFYMPVPGGYGSNGASDFICIGLKLVVECKAEDGMRPTVLQQAFMDKVVAVGGHAYLATPGTLRTLENLIIQLARGS